MRKHLRQSASGFTLIELLVVIIIMGVLAAIAAPGWVAFMNRQRLSSANDQLFQALRIAQTEAKRTSTYREVRFDTTSDPPRFAVVPLAKDNALTPVASITNWETLGGGNIRSGAITLTTTGTNKSITFAPDGTFALKNKVPTNPDLPSSDTAYIFSATVALRASSSVKRCSNVQTLLGALRQGSNTECL